MSDASPGSFDAIKRWRAGLDESLRVGRQRALARSPRALLPAAAVLLVLLSVVVYDVARLTFLAPTVVLVTFYFVFAKAPTTQPALQPPSSAAPDERSALPPRAP